jgi:hypothetical protein
MASVLVWAWVAGCGGSNASVSGGDGGAGDAATDGTSPVDTGSPEDDGSTPEAAPGSDTGTPDGGGDAGCTGTGATCRQCCRTNDASGYQKLVTAEAACACKPSICGPIDGGAGDAAVADASDLGVGACADTCTTKAAPDAACDKCLDDATGTMAAPGECYTDVSTVCEKEPDCVAYVTCLTGCQ